MNDRVETALSSGAGVILALFLFDLIGRSRLAQLEDRVRQLEEAWGRRHEP